MNKSRKRRGGENRQKRIRRKKRRTDKWRSKMKRLVWTWEEERKWEKRKRVNEDKKK